MLKLVEAERQAILDCVRDRMPTTRFDDRAVFEKTLATALKGAGLKVAAPLKKAIVLAIGKRDEAAMPCLDAQSNPEFDPMLRDFEVVPLKEDWQDFFDREVRPFAQDAWVDRGYVDARDTKIGRIGYEINFARYFYSYTPPQDVAEIDNELAALERDIAALVIGSSS